MLETLRSLFPLKDDNLEERQFSIIHKSVLGINSHKLQEILAIHGDKFDMADAHGMTPLIWASLRGEVVAVEHLLNAKADPNATHAKDLTPLIAVSQSGHTLCLRLLLAAGANPAQVCYSLKYNALHHAAWFQNHATNIRILTGAGVDVDGRSVWGTTPLIRTAQRNCDIAAATLLDCGADINSMDYDGDSALHQSVYSRSDDVMQVLLSHGATYTLWASTGDSILHLAAKSGGIRTLEILIAANLRGIDPDANNRGEKTALQVAQERERAQEGFVEKFQELIEDIRVRNASRQSPTQEEFNLQNHPIWLQYGWIPSIHKTVTSARTRNRQNQPHNTHGHFSSMYWLLGLFMMGCIWIYRSLEPGSVASFLTLIWDMVHPGDSESF